MAPNGSGQFPGYSEAAVLCQSKVLEPMRPQLPDDLSDILTLDAVADLLRITRNDAGHPAGRQVDEDTAYTHLQMAARYLQKMSTLGAYFRGLPATSA